MVNFIHFPMHMFVSHIEWFVHGGSIRVVVVAGCWRFDHTVVVTVSLVDIFQCLNWSSRMLLSLGFLL
jgi:hypothetical protein